MMTKLLSSKILSVILVVLILLSFVLIFFASAKEFKFITNEKVMGKVPLTILSGTEFDLFGPSKAGLRSNGTWTYENSGTYTQSYLGGGWCNLWNKSALKESYKMTVNTALINAGTSSDYPKFGVYAGYKDNDNFLLVMFDVKYNAFASLARINGKDGDWKAASIPAGIDLKAQNELKVIKIGNEFRVYVNGFLIEIYNQPIDKAQVGFVTEDSVVSYKDFNLEGATAFDLSKPTLRINGFGNSVSGAFQTNGWTVNKENVALDLLYSGWNSIFYGESLLKNYTFEFKTKLIEQGKDAEYPKFGAYAYYKDKDNYIVAMFDTKFKQFVSMERKNGKDGEWKGTAIDFDLSVPQKVKCVKNENKVFVFLNNIMYFAYSCDGSGAQTGFVTWEARAEYSDFSIKNTGVIDNYFGASYNNAVGVNGSWTADETLKQAYLGKGMTSLFYGLSAKETFTASIDAKLTKAGMSLYPKYGIYAANASADTFVWFFIHPKEYIVSSYGKVNGTELGWQTAKLPVDFDFNVWHNIKSIKEKDKISLFIDEKEYLTVNAVIGNAQMGFVTEDCAAEYKNPLFN